MGKYLGIYENATAIQSALDNGELLKPYVAFDEDTETLDYNSRHINYSKKYLTFTALEDGTFKFTTKALQYSLDNGASWTTLSASSDSPTVAAGNSIMWKQTGLEPDSSVGIGTFSSTGRFEADGNVMSLYYGDNFSGQTSLSGKNNAFKQLFKSCAKLINAENLVLPATELANQCYQNMFSGCTSLTTAPSVLPATTLRNNCYYQMFQGCSSLTTAPELPATTLAQGCYYYIFQGCTNLNYIKCLATGLGTNSTVNWVNGVAATGTFVKNANMSSWTTGNNGIPSNWTVIDA